MLRTIQTTAPVQAGDFTGAQAEFGRWQDLHRQFGIKRGTAYTLLNTGKIRGVLLRVAGQKSGVRLFDLNSIRDYIRQCQAEQEAK
jgi:hypothetical protein